MTRRFHFISGLPRSGSTLLSALLKQNPRFHAGMSSPMGGLFKAVVGELSGSNEFAPFISDAQRQRIVHGLFDNYYGLAADGQVIFDTSRGWCTHLPAIRSLFPGSRVIACVRDTHWIIDSIEQLVRRNPFSPSAMFNFDAGGTIYSRVNSLVAPAGILGFSYSALKEAFFGEGADSLMLLQYDTLANEPAKALAAIYDFIGEPSFVHDFEHVVFDAREYDARAGTPGLHVVRPRVAPVARKTVLPPDLIERFQYDAFWRNPKHNIRGVRIV